MSNGWHRKRTDTPAEKARRAKYNGSAHRAAGARFTEDVSAGRARCWRCGTYIPPGTPRAYRGRPGWVVGHDDHDVDVIRGPECYRCNKRAADRKGAAVANGQRKPRPRFTPRTW